MSLPPSDPWRPPQPPEGAGQQPGQGQPYGQAPGQHPQGQPYGQPPWGSQQPGQAPPGPPNKGSGLKWLLVVVAVLLVAAISVGATLLFTRDSKGDNAPTASPSPPITSGSSGEIASASDIGPVSVITDDPTCDPWRPIANTLAAQERNGWHTRDFSIPASAWTSEQRSQHDAVAQAMRSAADQTVALAKLTPHRVMRELYEQSIAYWRAYADAIPTYTPEQNDLAVVAGNSSSVLVSICAAITYRSAAARGPLTPQASPPSEVAPVGNPADPERFLMPPGNSVCAEWNAASDQFDTDTARWRELDPNIPASQWTIEQRLVIDQVAAVMLAFADKVTNLGQRSNNPTWQDFATMSAQYRRAYAQSLPTYTPADNYLSETAARLVYMVYRACSAAGS
jgi:hypothetical protein